MRDDCALGPRPAARLDERPGAAHLRRRRRPAQHTSGFEEPGLHDPEVQKSYYFVDTGIIAGNVYLFAASQGLACWFHNCDRGALARKLKLREGAARALRPDGGVSGHLR